MAGAILISFSSVYVKVAEVEPIVSGFYRVFIGGLFLLGYVLWKKERLLPDRVALVASVGAGLVFSVNLYFWHTSIHYIGPGLATVLANFQVFILAIVGMLFLKERMSLIQAVSIPVAFSGLFPVVGTGWENLSHNYKTGLFFALMTACTYSVYILILRYIQARKTSLDAAANLVMVSFVASAFLGFAVLSGNGSFVIPDTKSLGMLLALGILSQGVGWIMITNELPKVKAYLVGILLLLQPSLSFVWDVLFFARPTSAAGYAGLSVTLIAIYIGTSSGKKPALPQLKGEEADGV